MIDLNVRITIGVDSVLAVFLKSVTIPFIKQNCSQKFSVGNPENEAATVQEKVLQATLSEPSQPAVGGGQRG